MKPYTEGTKMKSLNSMQQIKVIIYLIYYQLTITALNQSNLDSWVKTKNKILARFCFGWRRESNISNFKDYPHAHFERIFTATTVCPQTPS